MHVAVRPTSIAVACAMALCAAVAHAGTPAAIGSGLQQLTAAWETGDNRLPAQLKLHVTNATGDPLVKIHVQDGASVDALLPQLQAAGFKLTAVSQIDDHLIEGFLPLREARRVVALSGVRSMAATQKPHRNAGAVQSQAVALEKANRAQASGYDGAGMRIGVLSDSYDTCPPSTCRTNAAADIGSGDLPADGVTVLAELPASAGTGEDEGRAMLQLVHDIAPAAKLGFATAFSGQVGFANNILALRDTFKADVIVDDVYYFAEPMFSDGVIAQAVDTVAGKGAAYFASAGNNGLEAYQATYTPISFAAAQRLVDKGVVNVKLDQIPQALRPKSLHLFYGQADAIDTALGRPSGPSIVQTLTSAAENNVSLQWDEPFLKGKVKTDYNVYVFDADGNWIDPSDPKSPIFTTTDDNIQTDEPFEYLYLPPLAGQFAGGANVGNYQIVIGKMNDGPANVIKYIVENALGVSQRQAAPAVYGHPAARGGQAVAATFYAIPNFPEDFSAPGPVTIAFDADGNRLARPEIREVPQLTAADGVDTTFFGFDVEGNGWPNFFGTSAASPDAAAVAALVLQAAGGPGSLRPAQVYDVLQNTATPIAVPNDRSWSLAKAGPLTFWAQGDWTRWKNYFRLQLAGSAKTEIKSIAFDLAATPLVFSANPNRFHLGDAHGVVRTDITQSVSGNGKSMVLTFKGGSFVGGKGLNFGMSAFNPLQGATQEDPDRFRDMKVTVTMADGATYTSAVVAPLKQPFNRFTGHGLVNADAATRLAATLRSAH